VPVAVNCWVWPWASDAVVGDTAMDANVPEQANAAWDVRASAIPTAAVVTRSNGRTRATTDLSQPRHTLAPPLLRKPTRPHP
jgi:hypothetical protein